MSTTDYVALSLARLLAGWLAGLFILTDAADNLNK